MEKTIVSIGSYSSGTGAGIYTFELDCLTGELRQLFEPVKIENPSYLILSHDRRFLYCVMETEKYKGSIAGGGVAAFRVGKNGSLKFLNEQPTHGEEPCHLCADRKNRFLLAANYGGGSFSVFPLDEDGSIKPCLHTVFHSGGGPVKGRQDSPHVHFTGFTPEGKLFYTVDLGTDQVMFYREDADYQTITPIPELTIFCRAGSGPRHLIFSENTVYVVNELSSDIGVFSLESGRFVPKQYISTVFDGRKGPNAPAALKISKTGTLLFASNRGHDSIAVFQIRKNRLLDPLCCFSSGSTGPRDFALSPDEKFMLIANETGNQVTVKAVNPVSRATGPTAYSVRLHRPSCILVSTLP